MPGEASFDPERVAWELAALADELHRDSATPARVRSLVARLEHVVRDARRWAAAQQIPAACIPDPPSGEALARAELTRFLRELAEVLLYLSIRCSRLDSMLHVVTLLRRTSAPALLELEELGDAAEALLLAARGVDHDAIHLASELGRAAQSGESQQLEPVALRADQVRLAVASVVAALGELTRGLHGWRLPSSSSTA